MKNKMSLPFLAFLQATGLVVYIILISSFFNLLEDKLPTNATPYYGFAIMVLVFVISAVISSLLVLGKAGYLFWEKKYKESLTLIGWTIGWGIVYLIIFLLFIYSGCQTPCKKTENISNVVSKVESTKNINEISLEVDAPFSDAEIVITKDSIIYTTEDWSINPRSDLPVADSKTVEMTPEKYLELTQTLDNLKFWELNKNYTDETMMDETGYFLTVKYVFSNSSNGKEISKTVSCWGGCPNNFMEIVAKIQEALGEEILNIGV
jgi:hypothetical protein